MDAESLLLVTSPTVSTISSFDQNESQQYPNNQLSNDSSSVTIDNLTFKKIKNTDIIIKPVSGYFQQPRKPEFRIRPPYLMICISIIEISVHCLGNEGIIRRWLVYDPRHRIQGWRFASYMLLHSNVFHLVLNVVIQLVLAIPLEVEQSRLSVGIIYLCGGVCGALGASLLQPSLYLVGASAGVYALLTSHLAHLYLCHGELRYAGWRLVAVLLLVGADIIQLPIPALIGRGKIGWSAHIAGAFAGPLIGLSIFPNKSKKDSRGRKFVKFVRFLSGVSIMLLIFGGIFGNMYVIVLPHLQKPS